MGKSLWMPESHLWHALGMNSGAVTSITGLLTAPRERSPWPARTRVPICGTAGVQANDQPSRALGSLSVMFTGYLVSIFPPGLIPSYRHGIIQTRSWEEMLSIGPCKHVWAGPNHHWDHSLPPDSRQTFHLLFTPAVGSVPY